MTIYYLDPHAAANGTGASFASPWSISATHTGLVAGDEIRVKGIPLTNLLTSTVYTASLTNYYSITITAGGGLGADFAAGNIVYLPAYDTFFRVYSVATNTLSLYSSVYSMLPIGNTATNTALVVRKVDTTTYPPGTTSSVYYLAGSYATTNNITISDGWTSETTRVTDGTVKTLLNSSYTSSMSLYLDSSAAGNITGWNVDLSNTHAMCAQGTTSGTVAAAIYGSSGTYKLNQIFSWYYGTTALAVGNTTTSSPVNNNITVTWLPNAGLAVYGSGHTINITNACGYYNDYLFGSSGIGLQGTTNTTVNVQNIIAQTSATATIAWIVNSGNGNVVNISGTQDLYASTSMSYGMVAYGNVTVNFNTGFNLKYNRRVSSQTTLTYGVGLVGQTFSATKIIVPNWNGIPGISTTVSYYLTSLVQYASYPKPYKVPSVVSIELPTTVANVPYGYTTGVNSLVTFRDGNAPYEILSQNSAYQATTTSGSFPVVSVDNTTYRTSAGSLKAYLATRTTAYWINNAKAIKNIKIPVTAGVTVTVTGFVRCSDAAYTNGDCRMSLVRASSEIVGQNMTTSCINGWEAFALSFTPTYTEEINLVWEMYYRTAGASFWLDDLVII